MPRDRHRKPCPRAGEAPRRSWVRLLAVLFFLPAALPGAESFRLFPPPVGQYFAADADGGSRPYDLDLDPTRPREGETEVLDLRLADRPAIFDAPAPKAPNRTLMMLITGGVLAGSAVSSLGVGHGSEGFHFANEEWFGQATYAGGADKASHFVFYNGLSRELGVTYRNLGYSPNRAETMGFFTAITAGFLVEMADGFTIYGFAWEDFAMDTLGAGTAALVTHYGLDDTVGFRFGKIPDEEPPPCCRTPGEGKDYSKEIYTADLKLAGFARRLNLRPGPARFLLLSMTYGSKGYRYSIPEFRQRNVGIELGVNFPEILSAVGVPEHTWWGRALYLVFNFFRVPFTSIGFYYDLNHHKWSGPHNGGDYDPGP